MGPDCGGGGGRRRGRQPLERGKGINGWRWGVGVGVGDGVGDNWVEVTGSEMGSEWWGVGVGDGVGHVGLPNAVGIEDVGAVGGDGLAVVENEMVGSAG